MSVILLEKRGPIAILTLNRPDSLNPLGHEGDGVAVTAVCADITADRSIRCAVLTGAGRAFRRRRCQSHEGEYRRLFGQSGRDS